LFQAQHNARGQDILSSKTAPKSRELYRSNRFRWWAIIMLGHSPKELIPHQFLADAMKPHKNQDEHDAHAS